MKIQLLKSLFSFALVCAPFTAQAESLDLLISKSDGTQIRYCLKELPSLSFDKEKLHVCYQANKADYKWSDIASYAYVKSENTALHNTESGEEQSVTYYDNRLTVYTSSKQMLTVYDLSGTLVLKKAASQRSYTEISYADFAKGTYILICGQHTYKFYVK